MPLATLHQRFHKICILFITKVAASNYRSYNFFAVNSSEIVWRKIFLMPIYEYQCLKCKAHDEILQKITDKPLTKCRKCGGRLEKQWSSTSFQLIGSGWSVTDYASKKASAREEKKAEVTEEKKPAASESPASTDKTAPKEKESQAKKSSETKNTASTAKRSNTSGD